MRGPRRSQRRSSCSPRTTARARSPGGQTLINVMKARAGSPDALVDLSRLEELKGIELGADGTLEIGAMTTYTEIVDVERGARAADPRRGLRADRRRAGAKPRHDRRQRLHERPDEPPAAAARGARRASSRSPARDGERTVSADEFFLGVYLTAVGAGRAADEDHASRRARTTASPPSRSASKARASSAPRRRVNGSVAHRARLRRRGAGRARRPPSADADAVRAAVARRRPRPAVRRPRLERVPPHLAEVLAVRAVDQARRSRS